MGSDALVLTFAIPTFNRLEFLQLLLDALAGQVERINAAGARMEILVCNNASTDGTAAYLAGLSEQGRVRAVNHAVNLGPDANMVQCFEQAAGRHVWIFGDDDLPLPGVMERVVDCLERDAPDLLYLPAHWHGGDLRPYLSQPPEPAQIRTVSAMALALQANAYVTFISSWVVNRESYRAIAEAPEPPRHIGTSLSQLEWQLTLLAGGAKLMTVEPCWVIARSGNTGGYPVFQVFSVNFNRVVDDKLSGHPRLRGFLRAFMLRSYLPVLVWGLRQGVLGQFRGMGGPELHAAIRAAWPDEQLFSAQLEAIMRLPKPLAFVVFAASRVYCKLWLAWLKWRLATGGNR